MKLDNSQSCPAGYTCGSGTDRENQFLHECPAGVACAVGTPPQQQYDNPCLAGYICTRGTPLFLATHNKCPSGYFCPDVRAIMARVEQLLFIYGRGLYPLLYPQ